MEKGGTGPSASIEEFREVLKGSRRVLALCGAGLSASSGLDTFRGAGGLWKNHEAVTLSSVEGFKRDPGLVWLFYSYRRHQSLLAHPNPGHYALAALSRKMEGFLTISQNVDGLSQRAGHPPEQLKSIHGSLYDVKCSNDNCTYIDKNNYTDPIHPILEITSEDDPRLASSKNSVKALAAYLDPNVKTTTIEQEDLPKCPKCNEGLLRPGIVFFGEALPEEPLNEVDKWIEEGKVDITLVIGTTAKVYPAAGYVAQARARGARVAVVNTVGSDLGAVGSLRNEDFLFEGDAAEILPELFKPLIGELAETVRGENRS
ncbi:DHS-like NAD/FAD-binding domain-containing protein [Bisporella sp. PMI_857]|nr:DHS-like NAD/FAD-binding domain-containing protein [Bisporella sp. PMI_857]